MTRALWPLWALALSLGWAVGCITTDNGFITCGGKVCQQGEECVVEGHSAECVCPEDTLCGDCPSGYEWGGQSCERTCPSGYRKQGDLCEAICPSGFDNNDAGACTPIPEYCAPDQTLTTSGCEPRCTNPCGGHGSCQGTQARWACTCDEGYTGSECTHCADGYQDNDGDGLCRPDCVTADLDCESPRECSDIYGQAQCACTQGLEGADCSVCAVGYRSNGEGCVPTCATRRLTCPPLSVCADSEEQAHCECRPGFVGVNCEECAEGYLLDAVTGDCYPNCTQLLCPANSSCEEHSSFASCECADGLIGPECATCANGSPLDNGKCAPDEPTARSVLTFLRHNGEVHLATVDIATGAWQAQSEVVAGGLVHTGGSELTFYSSSEGQLSEIEPSTGEHLTASGKWPIQSALAYDENRGRVLAVASSSPHAVLSIDVEDGFSSQFASAGVNPVLDLSYAPATMELYGIWGQRLISWSAGGTEPALHGELPPGSHGLVALDTSLLVLTATDLDAQNARIEACRLSAGALGLSGYEAAPGRAVVPEPTDQALTITSSVSEGPEVITYLGRATDSGARQLEVGLQNVDAVACLELHEATSLTIPAEAQVRALLVYAPAHAVTLAIEDGFTPVTEPIVHLKTHSGSFAFDATPAIVEHDEASWQELSAAIDPRFFAPGPGALIQINPETLEPVTVVPLEDGAIPVGPATLLPAFNAETSTDP